MSFTVQTPQRPLPGAYLQTPAINKTQSEPISQPSFGSSSAISIPRNVSQPSNQGLAQQSQQSGQLGARPSTEPLNPIERASKTINDTLTQEMRYPELDSYIGREYHQRDPYYWC